MTAALSVVIPSLNEAEGIESTLRPLQGLRSRGHDLILVDGGSRDRTVELARPLVDRILMTAPGRAPQMNAGAAVAGGKVLLFLHADTQLPREADQALLSGLETTGRIWGRFDIHLSCSEHVGLLAGVERGMNLRSRWTGIATGDQALFVYRKAFWGIAGYPEIALMEDIALSHKLKQAYGRPLCLRQRVSTSSRRWEEAGVVRTILLMHCLRLGYYLGADPGLLARIYHRAY